MRKRILFLLVIMLCMSLSIKGYAKEKNEMKAVKLDEFPIEQDEKAEFEKCISVYEEALNCIDKLVPLEKEKELFSTKVCYKMTTQRSDISFYGSVKKGKPEGIGVIFYNKLPIYIGEMKNGYKHGFGIELEEKKESVLDNSIEYVSICYTGEFENGNYCGEGTKYWTSLLEAAIHGAEADASIDALDLEGIIKTSDGYKKIVYILYIGKEYQGKYKDGKEDGKGISYYPNGMMKHEGAYKKAEFNGKGKLYSEDGILLYDGNFSDGECSGEGTLYYTSGVVKYKGTFKKNKYSGNGILYNEDGTVYYKGKFKNGDIE